MASDPGISHADLQTPKLHEKKKKPCFRIVGIRPWGGRQTLVRPMQTCRHPNKLHDKKDKPVCIMIFTMKKHIHYGIRPWYIPCRSADNQTNCMRRRRNLVSGLWVSDLGTPHTDPQTPKETALEEGKTCASWLPQQRSISTTSRSWAPDPGTPHADL